jgi:type VI secretion system protein VasG
MEIDIRTLLGRLNPECRRAMTQAAELCVQQTHFSVEIEHLLLRLLDPLAPDLASILPEFRVEPAAVVAQLQQRIDRFKRGDGRMPALSPHLGPLFQEAWLISAMMLGIQQIRSGTVLLAMLEVDSLRGLLLDMAPSLLQIPRETLRNRLAELLAHSSEDAGGAAAAPRPSSPSPAAPAGVSSAQEAAAAPAAGAGGLMPTARGLGDAAGATPALDQFTVDLTQEARAGRIDPICGRDAEIRQIVDVLLRRRQNNPILTGEPGVGKTAVVEGFALRVVNGDVPPALRDVAVRSLDLALLQAGAGIKGEFEHRLKSVIAEVRSSPTPIILFIDEAHQLIGAGGSEGQGDAANLLKPALARGELRTIAATTWAEYKKYVERDPALARRFQVVKVEEPEPEAAIEMLRGMVGTLQRHHGVEILDEAVCEAVRLSHRYISGRQLPDKAISVLDTACARVAVGHAGVPEALEVLTRDIVATEGRLRLLHHDEATGRPRSDEIARAQAALAALRERERALRARLEEERRAVEAILALRRRIAEDSEPATSPEAREERESRAAQLQRMTKGLEALREDDPLVPVCVDGPIVADVISGWTGIPVGKMMADEIHTVLHLKERLAERVVGQDQALDAIARRVRTFRADLDDPGKPVGVFLLVGPSGVGKTETACALADMLYGGERNMITINLSEFQEAHSVSSLKGAPPGYVGYGRGGVLTEAVRRRPYSVVLLDEMEKAHPDVLEMFFQVFDKGTMEDGEGVTIDFKNTLILLTSNAAQEVIVRACEGDARPDPALLVERLRPALLQRFSPAFLGRLVLVPYYPLGDEQIRSIVELKLSRLADRFERNHRASFIWDPAVSDLITARCTEVDSGARNIDFILTQSVLPELSRLVLERMSTARPFVSIYMRVAAAGQFSYAFEDLPVGVLP